MKRRSAIFLTSFFTILAFGLSAQEKDFGIRFGADITKELTKKIDLQLEEKIRLNQDATEFDRVMTTLGARYSFNKIFDAGLFYTWIYANNQEDGYYEHRHRFGGWLQAAKKYNRFKFSVREKFLTTYRDEDLGNYKYNPKSYLRSKLEVAYDVPKIPLKPYLSAEMHYQLNNPEGNETDKWRYTAGMEYDFTKKLGLDLFYRVDDEVNVNNPVCTSVIGAMIKYKF